jgi:hypothetical protein
MCVAHSPHTIPRVADIRSSDRRTTVSCGRSRLPRDAVH